MKNRHHVCFSVNGEPREFLVAPDEKLLDLLRREGLTGTKQGCGTGSCGSCTVIMDGKIVYACLLYAFQAEGRAVENHRGGSATSTGPIPSRTALVEGGAVQCGFCTPGIVLAAKALLAGNPHPTDEELKLRMDGNLCRCTGYEKIEAALHKVIAAGGAK